MLTTRATQTNVNRAKLCLVQLQLGLLDPAEMALDETLCEETGAMRPNSRDEPTLPVYLC
jgi:hypothetical protein